jgi:hypothetical protein
MTTFSIPCNVDLHTSNVIQTHVQIWKGEATNCMRLDILFLQCELCDECVHEHQIVVTLE